MNTENNEVLIDSFVKSMEDSIRLYANDTISDETIKSLAKSEVNQLDFENEWQMHKGIGYFAKKAVDNYQDAVIV